MARTRGWCGVSRGVACVVIAGAWLTACDARPAAHAPTPAEPARESPADVTEERHMSRPAAREQATAPVIGIVAQRTTSQRASASPATGDKRDNALGDLLHGSVVSGDAAATVGQSASPRAAVKHTREVGTRLEGLGTIGHGYGGGGLGLRGVGRGGSGYGYGSAAGGIGIGAPLASPGAFDTESYARVDESSFVSVSDQPLSTFSIDVDTASYSNVRRFLREGSLPPADAVRVEEMLNYFHYRYPAPTAEHPFSIHTEVANTPWASGHRLLLVGLQARDISQAQTPPRNLVFLIDVSGSMASPDRLPLLKQGLTLLARQLRAQDRIAIVVYAGASGVVLPTTRGNDHATVLGALERLEAGGSTNGADGIELAYRLARQSFIAGGVNRVVLATDGDFNVGITDHGALTRLIEDKRQSGVYLSVLGFGRGNLKDATMESLADHGNGNYAYIDSMREAQRALVRESGGTLVTLAQDVKLQVELNPTHVKGYRLIGYENRRLATQDFNDDRKDAGEMGAGHSVTALYEIIPQDSDEPVPTQTDALRYQSSSAPNDNAHSDELATVKIRYKQPQGAQSTRFDHAVVDVGGHIEHASDNLRWAAAVAGFGMILGQSEHRGEASLPAMIRLAKSAIGEDTDGDRAELLDLMHTARRLRAQPELHVAR